MAYISTEEVRAVRNALKAKFGKQFKFSVRQSDHMKLHVTILSGTVDFGSLLDASEFTSGGYFSVNSHHMHHCGEHEALLNEILREIKIAPGTVAGGSPWFDNTDIMTDYFDVAFYIGLKIGTSEKSYKKV
jgi:hypothetical protein